MFTRFDKAGAAALGSAIGLAIATLAEFDAEVAGAVTVLVTAGLTYLVPNKEF